MKYFLLQTDPLYVDAPVLQNWSGKIDQSKIMPGTSHQLPSRMIFDIYPNTYTTFIDIVDFPFLLLSKRCMDVVKLYKPHVISKQIILLDAENRNKQTYYLPILPHLNCLSERSIFSTNGELKECILELSCIKTEGMFHIAGLPRLSTVIRLDVLESMMKRGARGIKITPIQTALDEGRRI